MADAALSFLLENMKELLLYHTGLISSAKDQIESLHKELSLMKAFLKDSREKCDEFEYVREVVRQITDVTYEAEDAIDKFVVIAEKKQSRTTLQKIFRTFDYNSCLWSISREIETIREKVKEIYDKKMYGIVSLPSGAPSRRRSREKRPPMVEEAENVVGFKEEAKTIIEQLTKGSEQLDIVSVVGMGGLGKTTLARKVYDDPAMQYHFYLRAWVYVSQEYSRREVFRIILETIGVMNDQMSKMSDDGLCNEVCKQLKSNRYLIILDDVWTTVAWDDIRMALPNTNLGSRILLTTRNNDVALHANHHGNQPHNLRFLTTEESWELLCKKTFPNQTCPPELEKLGEHIAKKCCGLPLAIVVIAGLLLKKEKTREWWKRVADSVSTYVARDPERCMDVLALSYKHLPDHLKVCFIYFGIFPEDFEIPVWKLLRLWVAEGFVQENGQECLEDVAEDYLEDLVDRNLVLVAEKRANGRIKTCRIHDMLRDLCVKEGMDQKFLQVIKGSTVQNHLLQNYHRRLCIHSSFLEFVSSKPVGQHVRSFLCFLLEEQNMPRQHTSFIHEAFGLVRVLDLRCINLSKFPNEIVHLIHLRFVALFGNIKMLPETVSRLWNLQTIIIRTTNRDLNILVDIWKMLQLRHLHTSGISSLQGPRDQTRMNHEDPLVRRNILTISTISPESCTENILARTPNLRKLGIRGKLKKLMDMKPPGNLTSFDVLAKLDRIESLKMINDVFPSDPSQCTIPGLPPFYKFPPNLKKITLSDTVLGWEHMSTLGMLPNLEVVKLKNYAFKGECWEARDQGFKQLRVLEIERSDLVRWIALGHHFPRLQSVVFRHCSKLEELPKGLAEVLDLRNMELHWPSDAAARSARVIQGKKEKLKGSGAEFKLLVYPPDLS